MNLIKQFTKQETLAQVKTVTYTNVAFPHGFSHLIDSLEIAGLSSGTERSRNTGNRFVWVNECERRGITMETDAHPLISERVNMTVSGVKDALELFDSIVRLQGVLHEGSATNTPTITHEYHDELNPVLWERDGDTYTLRPEIKEALLDIAAEFVDFQKMNDLEISDITITGSCANYNWTGHSDIDLHMLVDFKRTIKQYGPLVPEYFEAKRKVWSDLHDISIKGIPVEPYMQNVHEKHHSTAIYSIATDEWLLEPTHNAPSIDDVEIKSKLKQFMSAIDDAITSNKARTIEALMDKIKNLRKAGLEEGGEFSTGNLVFKELRRNGYFEKLAECKTKVYDRELSVEDEEWFNLTQGE